MKPRTLARTLIAAAIAWGTAACSRGTIDSNLVANDTNGNNNIYRSYSVDYDEDTGRGMAHATFSVGGSWGTTLRLVPPASVSIAGAAPVEDTDKFDGGELTAFYLGFLFPPAWLFMGTSGTVYHKNLTGPSGTIPFQFVDNAGQVFSDTAHISQPLLTLPRSAELSGFTVEVSGAGGMSTIYIRLTQAGLSKTVTGTGPAARVTSADLTGFQTGSIEIQVEVSANKSIPADKRSLGGNLTTRYNFAKRTLRLW